MVQGRPNNMRFRRVTVNFVFAILIAVCGFEVVLADDIKILSLESGFRKLGVLPHSSDKVNEVLLRLVGRREWKIRYKATPKADEADKGVEFELSSSKDGFKVRRISGEERSSVAALACANECVLHEDGTYFHNERISFFGVILPPVPLIKDQSIQIKRPEVLDLKIGGTTKSIRVVWEEEYKIEGIYDVFGTSHARVVFSSKLVSIEKSGESFVNLSGIGGTRSAVLYYDIKNETVRGASGIQGIAVQLVGESKASNTFSPWDIWQK